MKNSSDHTFYRSRHGKIFGVCQGIADHNGLSVFWLRFFVVILAIFTGFFLVLGIYLAAALLMKLEPETPLEDDEEEFYNSMTSNRRLAIERLARRTEALDRRARRLEDIVTSRGDDWERRMNEPRPGDEKGGADSNRS
jgi:phage shock protein C